MVKMSDLSLRKKVIGGFLIISFTAVLIGLFGWYAAAKLGATIDKTSRQTIPALEGLSDMRDLTSQFVQSQEKLLIAYLDADLLKAEYDRLETIRAQYAALEERFEAIERRPEVEAAWVAYKEGFSDWGSVNNAFFEKLKEMEATGILSPLPLHAETLKAKGAFDAAIARMGGRIYNLEDPDGTDWGAMAASLSSWSERYRLENEVIEGEIMNIEVESSSLERYLNQLDSLIERGLRSQAAAIYQSDLLPVQASISDAFFKIGEEVDGAVAINRELNAMATGICSEKREEALGRLSAVIDAMKGETSHVAEKGESLYKSIRNTNFIIMAIALSLSVLMGIRMSVVLSDSINDGVSLSQSLADGDLTQSMDENRKDEIGDLGKALNSVVKSLHTMMGRINDGVLKLDNASGELSAVSAQVKSGAGDTSERSGAVAAAAEEMNTGIAFVASSVEEAAQNISTVASAAGQMAASIDEIGQRAATAREITDTAVSGTKNATQRVGALGESAKEIGTISETISGISQQINLLALNATIEAARAGEAGRGFAVVAGEIKDLAGETSGATEKIYTQVASVQSQIESTVVEIAKVSQVVGQLEEIVVTIASAMEEQAIATSEIAGSIEVASSKVGEVSDQVGENAATVSDIAKDIVGVSDSATEITASTDVLARCADEMGLLAQDLKGMTGRFVL